MNAIPIFPVTGFMDTRSTPDQVPFGGYRFVENWHVTQKHRLQRITGYTRFLDREDYNNQDLHNQLACERQTINMVYHARMSSGFTKVFAATQNRIYGLSNSTGNWQMISNCLGNPNYSQWSENVWTAAHIGSTVVFTDDYSKPVYHIVDQPLMEGTCGVSSPVYEPKLDYDAFAHWDVVMGHVDLVGKGTGKALCSEGEGMYDFHPGNGLYVDLCGSSPAYQGGIRTKDSFTLDLGVNYKLKFKMGGNRRCNPTGNTLKIVASVLGIAGGGAIFEETDWQSGFVEKEISVVGDGATHQLLFAQSESGMVCGCAEYFGCFIDDVRLINADTNAVIFEDNFDTENQTGTSNPQGDQGVSTIPDLEELNVSKVRLVVAWNNIMFYMNVEMDGMRYANRIIWSDYKAPLSVLPRPSLSLAGYTDIASGEVILNAKPLQDVLLIYTNLNIWEARVTGTDTEPITFRRRYSSDESGSRALAYWRTLVSDGKSHYYFGKDGIYKYDLYTPVPELVEYIHRASSSIFDNIRRNSCSVHCGGYYPKYRQIKWSWSKESETLPSQTLVVGTEFQFTSFEDEGYLAFCNTEPVEQRSLRDFLTSMCICTLSELESAGEGFNNEGQFCSSSSAASCSSQPTSFYTQAMRVYPVDQESSSSSSSESSSSSSDAGGSSSSFADADDLVIEDWTRPESDADSLCAKLGGLRVSDLCASEFSAGQCNPLTAFIQVAAIDGCLKTADDVYYREHCTVFEACGVYSKDGFKSTLLSGALHFNEPHVFKTFVSFFAEMLAEPSDDIGRALLWVGSANQAVDPSSETERCLIFWEEQTEKALQCFNDMSKQQNEFNQQAPDQNYMWGLYMRGKYLYFKLIVDCPLTDVGAGVSVSKFEVGVLKA